MTACYILFICIFGFIISLPLLQKPLSEDDGNWFYLGVFWHRGIRPFAGFSNIHGYFGVQLIFARLYNLLKLENLKSIPAYKLVWNILTGLSLYWLGICLWHSPLTGTLAALFYLIITLAPNTMFALTYAEHFYCLPINLSIIATCYGLTLDQPILYVFSGLMAGWAFQFKPTTLLFSILLPICLFWDKQPVLSFILYSGAFILVFMIPLGLLHANTQGRQFYLETTLGPFRSLMRIFLAHHRPNILASEPTRYTDYHYRLSYLEQWRRLKANTLPPLRDLYPLTLLALVQVFTLFLYYDIGTTVMGTLIIIHILTVIIQRNFYTPHFNPVWVPVGLLSAKCLSDLLEKPDPLNLHFILGSMLTLLLALHFGRNITKNFSADQRDMIGYMHPATGAAFRLAETIGNYIRQNSNPDEKLLVWGDHPSIYLYAGREALDTRLMFIYANLGRVANEKLLIPTMRSNPPEMVLFFNYKVKDDWDIKKIQNTIGVPFRHMQRFCIQNEQGRIQNYPNGIALDFNLYHRDDAIYSEIVLDRAILALRTGRDEIARSELSKLEKEQINFFEPILRNQLLSMPKEDVEDFLLKELEHIKGYLEKSVLLRILADIHMDGRNIDSAIDCYQKALDQNPDDYRSMTAMGEILFADSNTQSAMDFFKQALTINPYAVEAWNDLGVLLNSAGNPGEARTCFEKALQINPDHPEAGTNLNDLNDYKPETRANA